MQLAKQMLPFPIEAFTKLHFAQTKEGCNNHCGMCSMSAGQYETIITRRGMSNFFSALKSVLDFRLPDGNIASDKGESKNGLIYEYGGDDSLTNPNLDHFIRIMHDDFQLRVMLSSTGYSRHNIELQQMHETIVSTYAHAIKGLRGSFSLYPSGWRNPNEYILDFANMLKTYRPLLDQRGSGLDGLRVDIRHKPLVEITDVIETEIQGHHVIHAGPHLLISAKKSENIDIANVVGFGEINPIMDRAPRKYLQFVTDNFRNSNWQDDALRLIQSLKAPDPKITDFQVLGNSPEIIYRTVDLYCVENIEGRFYSVNPFSLPDGSYITLNIYPKTAKRKKSGYYDQTRYFLNALIQYKQSRGLKSKQLLNGATYDDIDAVIENLVEMKKFLSKHDKVASEYIEKHEIPLVRRYKEVLMNAEFPAHLFFDPDFSYIGGPIKNLGRAISEFKGIISHQTSPLTVQDLAENAQRKKVHDPGYSVWKLMPIPIRSGNLTSYSFVELNYIRTRTPKSTPLLVKGVEALCLTPQEALVYYPGRTQYDAQVPPHPVR